MMLAIGTLIGSLRFLNQISVLVTTPISRGLLLLQVPIAISVVTAIDPAVSYQSYVPYVRMMVMILIILVCIQTEAALRTLLIVIASSVGFLGLKFGGYALVHGGVRYAFGYANGLMSDNNDLALACAMTVPLCWYMRLAVTRRLLRAFLLACVFGLSTTVVMTHSRGGALSLATVLIAMALRSKRKLFTFVLLVASCAPAVYLVKDSYFDRMATLQDVNAEASARSRIDLALAAYDCWREHPLFGVGYGMRNAARILSQRLGNNEELVVHNTYLQMLVDSGIIALALYVILHFGTIAWLGRSAARMRQIKPELAFYPVVIQSALLAFAVGSTFLSRVQFDMAYMIVISAASWWQVERNIIADSETAEIPADTIGAATI
jgi:probable O-glycosylation ligase (exosortase A-associated)